MSESKFESEVKSLKSKYPGISFGYIGNLSLDSDDRGWYIFFGDNKKWGGYGTKELPKMWAEWQKVKSKVLSRFIPKSMTEKISNYLNGSSYTDFFIKQWKRTK